MASNLRSEPAGIDPSGEALGTAASRRFYILKAKADVRREI